MPKQGGMRQRLWVGGFDLSGDIQAINTVRGGPAAIDMTDITQEAVAREGGVRDGEISARSYFDPAANASHARFSGLPTADTVTTYLCGITLGAGMSSPVVSCVGKQIGYDGTRATDGSFTLNVQALANGFGVEWGDLATNGTGGKATVTGAGVQPGIDYGAASAFGCQGYLHVFAFSGTDAQVRIQQSSDDGSGDAYTDITGGSFSSITTGTPFGERIATSPTLALERWLRVAIYTTGGFSSLTFGALITRNLTATAF